MTNKSNTLQKAVQLALLTKRLPSEILHLKEEELTLFELDYQLLMQALTNVDEEASKKKKLLELVNKRGTKHE